MQQYGKTASERQQIPAKNEPKGQKIAVIGAGISGLTTAYLLSREHTVTLFEASHYLGGHTHTRQVECGGIQYPVNTGFIVFNDWTYPNFIKLMQQLGVESEDSDMSFSVRCENTGLEYNGTSLNSLFAQRINILRPAFLRMVADILRFNREGTAALASDAIDPQQTLGEFIQARGYSEAFQRFYIVPMGAAIWSASVEVMMNFPLRFFLQFFHNHGMLNVDDRPQWRVLTGGSQSYVAPLSQSFSQGIRLNTPVHSVARFTDHVVVHTERFGTEHFDQVVFACHSDQALKLLADPSQEESRILGAIPYQTNSVILHTDTRMMPKRRLAWASWNYHIPQRHSDCAMVTYNMNLLQNFHTAPETFLVTLNRPYEIDPDRIIESFNYAHPVFTLDGIQAQQKHAWISGRRIQDGGDTKSARSHYCGAYWFNGFHEDGVNSALRVAAHFGITL